MWNKPLIINWIKTKSNYFYGIEELEVGLIIIIPSIFHTKGVDIGEMITKSHTESLEKNLNQKPF
jgi:hypothetical protein